MSRELAVDVLASALLPPGVRGRLNSTFEDECKPLARDLVRKLSRRGYRIVKVRRKVKT